MVESSQQHESTKDSGNTEYEQLQKAFELLKMVIQDISFNHDSPKEQNLKQSILNFLSSGCSQEFMSDLLDYKKLLGRVCYDRDLLSELINIYLSELPQKMEDIKQAIVDQDSYRLERCAHNLKGASANLCTQYITDFTEELERMGKDGSLKNAWKQYEQLEGFIIRLKPVLLKICDDEEKREN